MPPRCRKAAATVLPAAATLLLRCRCRCRATTKLPLPPRCRCQRADAAAALPLPQRCRRRTATAAAMTAISAAIAADFWLIVVCGPCPVHYSPPPLPRSSCRLMTLSSHRGHRHCMTLTLAKPMPGMLCNWEYFGTHFYLGCCESCQNHLDSLRVMGWRNFFSSCAVVSVFGSGRK